MYDQEMYDYVYNVELYLHRLFSLCIKFCKNENLLKTYKMGTSLLGFLYNTCTSNKMNFFMIIDFYFRFLKCYF